MGLFKYPMRVLPMRKSLLFYISGYGVFLYLLSTSIAIYLYPGGNKFDRSFQGHSFKDNFWCDLFSQVAYNGALNPGRVFAILGNYVIAFAMISFWISISELFKKEQSLSRWVKILGPIAMLFTLLISTPLHDIGMHASVSFGLISFTLTIRGLFKCSEKFLAWLGVSALFVTLMNYLSLVFRTFPQHLPFVQKFSILFCLVWVVACILRMAAKNQNRLA